jgi:VanZ family protein
MRWIFPVLWAGVILFLSLMPASGLPKNPWFEFFFIDKWVHVFIYALLASLLFYAWRKNNLESKSIFILLICVGYGLLMEVLQENFTATRHFELLDAVADAGGALSGIFVWRFFKTRTQKKNNF